MNFNKGFEKNSYDQNKREKDKAREYARKYYKQHNKKKILPKIVQMNLTCFYCKSKNVTAFKDKRSYCQECFKLVKEKDETNEM